MDFIGNTSPNYVQVQLQTQEKCPKRVQSVQEDETGLSTQECQLAVGKCQSTLP